MREVGKRELEYFEYIENISKEMKTEAILFEDWNGMQTFQGSPVESDEERQEHGRRVLLKCVIYKRNYK